MNEQTIAKIILSQLGGGRFIVMTGAKQLVSLKDGLSMRLPSNMTKSRITHFEVRLTPTDLYDLKALRIMGVKEPVVVSEESGVFVEDLRRTFTSMTGLETSL